MNEMILLLMLLIGVWRRVSGYAVLLMAGGVLFLHPLILQTDEIQAVYQVSNWVLMLLITGLFLLGLEKVLHQHFKAGEAAIERWITHRTKTLGLSLLLLVLAFVVWNSTLLAVVSWFWMVTLLLKLDLRFPVWMLVGLIAVTAGTLMVGEPETAERFAQAVYFSFVLLVLLVGWRQRRHMSKD